MALRIRVYDDGDKVADRYDVRMDYGDGVEHSVGMSEDALMPNGVNMYNGCPTPREGDGEMLVDLPKQVLVAIIRRMM